MINIDFNQQAKQYEWFNTETGSLLTAPCGPTNKASLFQTAVALTNPTLWQTATRWIAAEPYLERTIWKGVELVANNGVETFPDDGPLAATPDRCGGRLLARVQSSDAFGRYSVTNSDGYIVCECQHYQDGGAPLDQYGQKTCKHIAAYRLSQ